MITSSFCVHYTTSCVSRDVHGPHTSQDLMTSITCFHWWCYHACYFWHNYDMVHFSITASHVLYKDKLQYYAWSHCTCVLTSTIGYWGVYEILRCLWDIEVSGSSHLCRKVCYVELEKHINAEKVIYYNYIYRRTVFF